MVATNSVMLPLGTPAPDFSLIDCVNGRQVTRAEFVGKPLLVLFICNHCPYVQFIRSALAEVTRSYLARGVAVVGISSNDADAYPADGPEAMASEAAANGYPFPYLYDADQSVATAYHAACTPDLMLFDRDHRLFYRGQFCAARRKVAPVQIPTGADLTAAVDAVLTTSTPPSPQRSSIGCNIKWKPGREPSYFQSSIVR
jgi:peroxiredoxin